MRIIDNHIHCGVQNVSRHDSRDLTDLPLSDGLRLLVLAPHPDDFDTIGVTLRFLHKKGHLLNVGVMRTGGGVENGYRSDLTLKDKASLREREQRASARFFGLPDQCLTFFALANSADDEVMDTPANQTALAEFVSQTAPDIVFLPHGNDTNSAHQAMYAMFRRIAAGHGHPLAAFLVRDPKTIAARTDVHMPFYQDEADWKAELLRFHDTQQQRNLNTRGHGFDDRILEVNRRSARELSLAEPYAETFEIELYPLPQPGSRPELPFKKLSAVPGSDAFSFRTGAQKR